MADEVAQAGGMERVEQHDLAVRVRRSPSIDTASEDPKCADTPWPTFCPCRSNVRVQFIVGRKSVGDQLFSD